MFDDTPRDVIQRRFDRLVELVQRKALEQNRRFFGRDLDVLFEGPSRRDPSMLVGHSPHNVTVHAPLPAGMDASAFVGRTRLVHIDEAKTWYLSGTLVER